MYKRRLSQNPQKAEEEKTKNSQQQLPKQLEKDPFRTGSVRRLPHMKLFLNLLFPLLR